MASDYVPFFHCQHCLDTSWRPFRCDGGGDRAHEPTRDAHLPVYPCGRKPRHLPHGYVERCGCAATNPVIQRRHGRTEAA